MTWATGGAGAQVRFAAHRAAALPECTRHRRSSTQRVLQPPPCGRRRGQRHPLPNGRGAQEPPAFAGGHTRPRPKRSGYRSSRPAQSAGATVGVGGNGTLCRTAEGPKSRPPLRAAIPGPDQRSGYRSSRPAQSAGLHVHCRGTAPHDPRKARGFMCTQGASRGCRRGAAHLSPRASPRGLTPHRAPRASPGGSPLTAPLRAPTGAPPRGRHVIYVCTLH